MNGVFEEGEVEARRRSYRYVAFQADAFGRARGKLPSSLVQRCAPNASLQSLHCKWVILLVAH
ncbi:hypothetical protein CSV65_11020 [Sporosarcina sp. P31]|nr:hypothetical protein CSV66_10615 [Sporosarcina sp. P30]PID08437.1 hypothetical protein CSV65_11020 [Sporosarcina sp. P31]PID12235.1 hypothetical protein CSV64_07615 [Sporosarcina sp. P32b]